MPKGPRRGKLLYLQDNAESLALAEAFLAGRKDVALASAPDLESLIKLARRERPEVVLIDADLTGLAPRDLMTKLRAEPVLNNVPIIALAADPAPAVITQNLEAGVFVYLVKPLQAQPFLETLAFAMEFAAAERAEQL
jgi:CheY-like chemotaxis protein